MAHQFPNTTGQAGVYKTGTPDYIEVPVSAAAISGRVKFETRAAADSWADGDTLGVRVYTSSKSLIAVCAWDATNKRLLVTSVEDSSGAFADNEAVSVESVLSKQSLASVANDFVPVGGVFVEVPAATGSPSVDVFNIVAEHNGKTLCVTGERWLMIALDLPAGFHCSILQETTAEVRILPIIGTTLNGGTTNKLLSGPNTGAYLYARTKNTFRLVL